MGSLYSGYSGGRASFRMLIVGESGTGKTRTTSVIASALASIAPGKVAIIDFAPSYKGVGRPLEDVEGAVTIRPQGIKAPRLMGRSCDEVWSLARYNARLTTEALRAFLASPLPVLIINDLTIHLHSGDPGLLYRAIDSSTIFVGNAYYGERLRDDCGLWERERALVDELSSRVNLLWRLQG